MAGMAGRRVGKLAARKVETIAKSGLYGDGANLYLKVDTSGAKSWIFRWEIGGGKVRKIGLGPLHTVSLSEARDRAEKVRKQIFDGIDPRLARREAKAAALLAEAKAMTFDQAAEAYIEAHKAGWKSDKHASQWAATLKTYASPHFGKLPVAAIDTGLVLKALEPIWVEKTDTASKVRGRIESVLDWAKVRGYRDEKTPNPAVWKGGLKHLLPARDKVHKVEHHAALPYAELPAFMRDLRKRYGVGPLALEFCILTATRTSETLNATWDEVHGKVWTIPAERMKGGREHRIPLCDRALAIIEDMKAIKHGKFIFPGARRGRPLSNMALLTVLRRMGRGDLTTHGFRATFKTWATERTNFQREICEVALAHDVGDKTEQAYQRGDLLDKRRRLMIAWGAYFESKPAVKASNVTALRP